MRALCIRGLGVSGSRALAISGVIVRLSPRPLSAASVAITHRAAWGAIICVHDKYVNNGGNAFAAAKRAGKHNIAAAPASVPTAIETYYKLQYYY